jgi:exonuclease III
MILYGFIELVFPFTLISTSVFLIKTTYSKTVQKDRAVIHPLMRDLGLVDIWRLVDPREKEYTFLFTTIHLIPG